MQPLTELSWQRLQSGESPNPHPWASGWIGCQPGPARCSEIARLAHGRCWDISVSQGRAGHTSPHGLQNDVALQPHAPPGRIPVPACVTRTLTPAELHALCCAESWAEAAPS